MRQRISHSETTLCGKHIALVANTTWSIYQYRGGVIRELLRQGVKISIIAPKDYTSEIVVQLGCDFHPLNIEAKGTNPLTDWSCFNQLLKLYGTLRPDCIFHYTIKPNIYGAAAARLQRIPSIGVITGLGFAFINNSVSARVARTLFRLSLRTPHQVWFLNPDDAQEFVSRRLVKADRAVLLPGEGIDVEHFSPAPPSPQESPQRFRFLLIGRMLWDKGVGEYVEAARRIRRVAPHVVFQLLGPADVENPRAISRAQLQTWEDEGVIEYLGATRDVRPAIGAADCIVLPSYREGMSRTLLEAAAMEKPIVATNVPGCRDIVGDGITGRLCQPRNPDSLQDAMVEIAALPKESLIRMGQAARQDVIERFSEARIIDIYAATIREVAENFRG